MQKLFISYQFGPFKKQTFSKSEPILYFKDGLHTRFGAAKLDKIILIFFTRAHRNGQDL